MPPMPPFESATESSELGFLFAIRFRSCCLLSFLCAPTGKIGAQTSASTHFLAKKVSALGHGSSLPIGDMKGILHVSASAVVCSERFLPTDYPPWTRFGEGEAGFQASSQEAEVETRGSSAGLSVQAKADCAPVA